MTRDEFIRAEVGPLLDEGEHVLHVGTLLESASPRYGYISMATGILAGFAAVFACAVLFRLPVVPGMLLPSLCIVAGFVWPIRVTQRLYVAVTERRLLLLRTNWIAGLPSIRHPGGRPFEEGGPPAPSRVMGPGTSAG